MTEIEKIAYAKSFIDKLANGINPIDGSVIAATDTVKNERLSKCFFYVSDILQKVIENGGLEKDEKPKAEKPKRRLPSYSPEQLESFRYSESPITSAEMVKRIIETGVKRFAKKSFTAWLVTSGFVDELYIEGNRILKPTKSGEELGFTIEKREGQYGVYYVLLLATEAQHFVIDNIEALFSFDINEYRVKMNMANQGKPWDSEQDTKLLDMYNEGHDIGKIAAALGRSKKSITIRLMNKGFDLSVPIPAKGNANDPDSGSSDPADKSDTPSADRSIPADTSVEATAEAPTVTCLTCKLARSGECFPQKQICKDYEKAFEVPKEERKDWPLMGDASYLKQTGRHRK